MPGAGGAAVVGALPRPGLGGGGHLREKRRWGAVRRPGPGHPGPALPGGDRGGFLGKRRRRPAVPGPLPAAAGKTGRPPERAGGAAGGGGPLPPGGHLRGGRQRLPFGGDAGLRRCPHRPPAGADTGRPAGDRKRLRVPGSQCAGVLGAAAGLGEYGGGRLLQLLDFGRRQPDSRPVLGAAHAPAAHVPAAGLGLQLVRRRL